MFASRGIQLLREMQRTNSVPAFNVRVDGVFAPLSSLRSSDRLQEDVLRTVVEEMNTLVGEIVAALTAAQHDPEMANDAGEMTARCAVLSLSHVSLAFSTKVLIYHTSLQVMHATRLLSVSHRLLQRNKRICTAYLIERLERIKTMAW